MSKFFDDAIYLGVMFNEPYQIGEAAEKAALIKKILGSGFNESIERDEETNEPYLVFDKYKNFLIMILDGQGLRIAMYKNRRPKSLDQETALAEAKAVFKKVLEKSDLPKAYEDVRLLLEGYYVLENPTKKNGTAQLLGLLRGVLPRRKDVGRAKDFVVGLSFAHEFGEKEVGYSVSKNKRTDIFALKMEAEIIAAKPGDSVPFDVTAALTFFDNLSPETELDYEYEAIKELER